ncbi:MAG: DUF2254 domain-containing protein [Candidatus Delongbacteria bacterium]|nr:DUF2254 domain-containing protein [Candidatus Delongbacteria bacterium]
MARHRLASIASLSIFLFIVLVVLFIFVFSSIFVFPHSSQILEATSSFNEVVIGLLAILITVVAIIVELAATRYSSRIIDLFIEDRVNLSVISFYILTGLYSLWVYYLTARGYPLHFAAFLNLIGLSICLILIIPYFAYIFRFLKPENVVVKMTESLIHRLNQLPQLKDPDRITRHRIAFVIAIEQIADIALNAVQTKDNTVGLRCLLSLKELLTTCFDLKPNFPSVFFAIPDSETIHPDYVALSPDKINQISHHRIFMENKVLKHYLVIFTHCLNENRDLNNMLAMCSRLIAEKALRQQDEPALRLCIKHFNTYLRFTLNTHDIRTAYNVAYQYKLLAIALLNSSFSEMVLEIANYLKYYGLLFYQQKIGFILETIAHDMADVCIAAEKTQWNGAPSLLEIFLTVDRPADPTEEDRSLRGVRKAQIRLAAFYHYHGNIPSFHKIALDMHDEAPDRIRSIIQELLQTQSDFWEIIDRGGNFDYIPEEWRPGILSFLDYFSNPSSPKQGVSE